MKISMKQKDDLRLNDAEKLPPLDDTKTKKIDEIEAKIIDDGVKEIHGPDFSDSSEDDSIYEEETKKKQKKEDTHKRGIGCSCRSCSCIGCLGFVLLLILLGLMIYFRPPFLWNATKKFLNAGYSPNNYEKLSTESVIESIKNDLSDDGLAQISEAELQNLAEDNLNIDDLFIDVEPNYFRIVSNLEDNDNPLWFIFEIGQGSDNSVKVTKIGFERVGVPGFLQDTLSKGVFSAIDFTTNTGDDDSIKLIKLLLDAEDENININSVRFDKDIVVVNSN